jgi:hypothetical protein
VDFKFNFFSPEMNTQVSQHILYANLNGHLLRISVKPSTNDPASYTVDLEQFSYDSMSKQFDLHCRDIITKKLKVKYEQTKAKFAFMNDKLVRQISNSNSLILIGELRDKQKIIRHFFVIFFDEISESCTINNDISEKVSNLISDLEEKDSKFLIENLQICVNAPSKTYTIFYLEKTGEELSLKVNQSSNLPNEWESHLLFTTQHENFQCIAWIEVSNNDDSFGKNFCQKIIFFVKISNKNQEFKQIKSFIYDCYSHSLTQIYCEQFFGNFFDAQLTRSSLFEENTKMNFSDLNQNFFNNNLLLSNFSNEKQLNLVSIKLVEYFLKFRNQTLELSGSCILILENSTQSYILFLKNGNLISKISSNFLYNYLKIVDQYWSDENFEGSKYLLFKSEAQDKYDLYTLNSNSNKNGIKLQREINACYIGYDIFSTEQDLCYFLVMKNWNNDSFEMIENFSTSKYLDDFNLSHESSAMELGDDFESMNISLSDQTTLATKESSSTNHVTAKKNFQLELLKLLEYKKHTSVLLLNEALIETKFKYSLIVEITNEYSQENTIKAFSLPKTIHLYTNRIRSREKDLSKIKNENLLPKKVESYFKLESTWSAWMDQSFLINFVFSNKSR